MPRRSLRVSDSTALRSSSKRPSTSEETTGKEGPKTKRAKLPVLPKKAKEPSPELSLESSESEEDDEVSGYEDSNVDEEESDDGPQEEPLEEESTSRRQSTGTVQKNGFGKTATPRGRSKAEKDLSVAGVKGGLGPGTQVVIKKPRARSPGDTPYTDETIHPNTMLFLEELAANNNRQWLKSHDLDYRTSWKDFESFLDALTQGIVTVDETVPELPVKDIIFRIYRDVRFSKDQTPYKTAFSAAWSRTGRKGPYAVYYVQIKPNGGSLIAGGLWMPDAAALAALRRDIDRRPQRLKTVLSAGGIRKEFLGGVAKDEAKVVKRFVDEHTESSLKTKPKGFDADHKDIALLRLKNFTLQRKLRDEEVASSNAVGTIVGLISHLVPFVTYLNDIIRPDEEPRNGTDDENDDDEEEDD